VFEYLGYLTDTNGKTRISFRVTNQCKYAISYVAIGTSDLTRIAPADGSVYSGQLGRYNVSWTRTTGNPGFVSIAFAPTSKNFDNGASDVFDITVGNFNVNTIIQVQAHAGTQTGTFSFSAGQTVCASVALPARTSMPSDRWWDTWDSLVIWTVSSFFVNRDYAI
jgi:hypothetical protein